LNSWGLGDAITEKGDTMTAKVKEIIKVNEETLEKIKKIRETVERTLKGKEDNKRIFT
jgi:hypothetical protein